MGRLTFHFGGFGLLFVGWVSDPQLYNSLPRHVLKAVKLVCSPKSPAFQKGEDSVMSSCQDVEDQAVKNLFYRLASV